MTTPSSPPQPLDPAVSDRLELELRHLAGVTFVAFAEQEGATVVELAAGPQVDPEELRMEALRLALGHLEGPVVVDVIEAADPGRNRSDLRVQLLLTLPVAGEDQIEVHLAHQHRRVASRAMAGDRMSVVDAVLGALRQLGLPVPFEAMAVHTLGPELGDGTLVVLRDPLSGQVRRGLASSRIPEESTARAVLNGLNRYLQTALVGPPDGG